MPGLINNALILIVIFFLSLTGKIQNSSSSIKKEQEINTIEFADSALVNFKLKTDSLKNGSRQKIKIVHIGDSHIQADYFTGEIRKQLQARLGDGGRGLIFPYSIAKTNGPGNYFNTSGSQWQACRNAIYPRKFPIGICGISIKNYEGGNLILNIKDSSVNNSNGALFFYSTAREKNLVVNEHFIKKRSSSTVGYDTVFTKFYGKQSEMKFKEKSDFIFHGAYLENDSRGIIYNMIGVNGACYKDYNATEYFFEQLPLLQPDLVIISLGTNESYFPKYDESLFEKDVNSFIKSLKKACPNSAVILTTASENYFKGKNKITENKKVLSVNNVIRKTAMENNFAVWDLYRVMGGKGSMKTWKNNKLTANDYVHFSRKGYTLQGDLFATALLNFISPAVND